MSRHIITDGKFRKTHTEGATRVHVDGGLVVSGGNDNTVSLFTTQRWPTALPIWSVKCHNAAVTSVCVLASAGLAVSGGRDGAVFLHENIEDSDNHAHRILCRVTGEINCVLFSPDGRYVFVAGDSVRYLRLSATPEETVVTTVPLNVPNPIISLALSPCLGKLALASASGSVGVVSTGLVENKKEKFLIRNALAPNRVKDEKTMIKLCWLELPAGEAILCIPQHKSIRLLKLSNDDTLSGAGAVSCEECDDITSVYIRAATKNKVHLVVGGSSGTVQHMKLTFGKNGSVSSTVSASWGLPTMPSDLAIDVPKGHLAIATVDGRTTIVPKVLPKTEVPKEKDVGTSQVEDHGTNKRKRSQVDDDLYDDDDVEKAYKDDHRIDEVQEDLKEVVSDLIRTNPDYIEKNNAIRKKVVSTNKSSATAAFIDDEAEESDEEDEYEYEEQEVVDDDYQDGDRLEAADEALEVRSEGDHSPLLEHPVAVAVPTSLQQYAVQLGATKADAEGSRYLCFNALGAVRRGADSTIHVQFHDMSRAQVKLQEKRESLCAALGVNFVALCLSPTAEHQQAAATPLGPVVYCRLFNSIGTQTDWSQQLAFGETPTHIACGRSYVAVFTCHGYLRIFSISGLEMAVVSLSEHVVTMFGRNVETNKLPSQADPLVIVTQNAGKLQATFYDIADEGNPMQPNLDIALSPESKLAWIGYGTDGRLFTSDNVGVVRVVSKGFGSSWLPVHDPRHVLDTSKVWVWGIVDDVIMGYRCAPGEDEPPASLTLPTLERVPMCLPLLRSNTDKHVLQRSQFLLQKNKTTELKKTNQFYSDDIAKADMKHDQRLLEMFETALKINRTSRAIDIATMLELRSSLEAAARKANDMQQRLVTEKVVAILTALPKKFKHRCPLPNPGSEVSDKEKDRILRRLLAKEKAGELGVQAPSQQTQQPQSVVKKSEPADAPVRAPAPSAASDEKKRVSFANSTVEVASPPQVEKSTPADTAPPQQQTVARPATSMVPAQVRTAETASTEPSHAKQKCFFKPAAKTAAPAPLAPTPAPPLAATATTTQKPSPKVEPVAEQLPKKQSRKETTVVTKIAVVEETQPPVPAVEEEPPKFVDVPLDPFLAPGEDGTKVEGWNTFDVGIDDTQQQPQLTAAIEKGFDDSDDDGDAVPTISIG